MDSIQKRLILLAPSFSEVPAGFSRVGINRRWHESLLGKAQTLRGTVYLSDGAIEPWEVSADGRHRMAFDDDSWHLLIIDDQARVCGCLRYLQHEHHAAFEHLSVHNAALAQSDRWGKKLKAAVESELASAQVRDAGYVEVGGWAISEDRRRTGDALRVALATYSLAQLLGDAFGIATATVRHGSSSILRKIGGQSLEWEGEELPQYYDPQYRCFMEILRFDSWAPAAKYRTLVQDIRSALMTAPVICRELDSTRALRRERTAVAATSYSAPAWAVYRKGA